MFEATNDIAWLGKALGALAHAEDELGHLDRAINQAKDALRFNYLAADPRGHHGQPPQHRLLLGAGTRHEVVHDRIQRHHSAYVS